MPPDTLADLILEGQAKDHTTNKARMVLGLRGGYSAEEHSVAAMPLHQYKSH
jgi:hypothetical protein